MDRQHSYRSSVLDHRGFVAGMFDELGIIDQATPQHPEMGLGLVNQPLALVPRLFQDTPMLD